MLTVQVDENLINELLQMEIQKRLDKLERQQTFWDTDDLKKHTRMSWNTIQDNFFHDPDFPKAKIGGKWIYPAKEAEQFLLNWLQKRMEESA